jgi:hypothetical protein
MADPPPARPQATLTAKNAKSAKDGSGLGKAKTANTFAVCLVSVAPQVRPFFACFALFAVQNDFDLQQPAIVDKIFARVLGGIFGRFGAIFCGPPALALAPGRFFVCTEPEW